MEKTHVYTGFSFLKNVTFNWPSAFWDVRSP